PEAVLVGGPILPVPDDGYLPEVRDPAELRRQILQPELTAPPPEINHEEPEERPVDRRRTDLYWLLYFVTNLIVKREQLNQRVERLKSKE
ncbi:unnamed protein product, partial [Linum tenue]